MILLIDRYQALDRVKYFQIKCPNKIYQFLKMNLIILLINKIKIKMMMNWLNKKVFNKEF